MTIKLKSSTLVENLGEAPTVFITCASFEDRCLEVSAQLTSMELSNAIIFYIDEFSDHSEENRKKLGEYFNGKSMEVALHHNDQWKSADKIIDVVAPITIDKASVLVDISTFTREALLMLLKALDENRTSIGRLQVVYTCASKTSSYLSRDIVETRSVLGFMGEIVPSRPLHLVVLLGFEFERAQQIIEEYEPDYISIGYGGGDESISAELHEQNVHFKEMLVSFYSANVVEQFDHSLIDPFNTRSVLEKVISDKANCNTVIVPLNNKISTVGVGIYAAEWPEVQVCYAQMASYNFFNYSISSEQCYLIEL